MGRSLEQEAARTAAMERVRVLLAERPLSNFDISARLGIPSGTVYAYLREMEENGEAYKMDGHDERGRKRWALDSEDHQAATDRAQAEQARRAWKVPARQVGMQRDPLVAALFGPARRAA